MREESQSYYLNSTMGKEIQSLRGHSLTSPPPPHQDAKKGEKYLRRELLIGPLKQPTRNLVMGIHWYGAESDGREEKV